MPGVICREQSVSCGLPKWEVVLLNCPLNFTKTSLIKTSVCTQHAPGLLRCLFPSLHCFIFLWPMYSCIPTEVSRVSPASVPLFSSSHRNQREFCTWLKQGAGRGPQDMAWQSWIPPSVHRSNPSALKQSSPRKNSVFCVFRLKWIDHGAVWTFEFSTVSPNHAVPKSSDPDFLKVTRCLNAGRSSQFCIFWRLRASSREQNKRNVLNMCD